MPGYQIAPLNEEDLIQAQVAFETTRGTYKAPTFDMPLAVSVTGTRPVQDIVTATGTYDRGTAFSMGGLEVTGTLGGSQEQGALAFEDIGIVNRLGLGGSVSATGVSDGGTPAGYLWTGRPSSNLNDQGSLSAEVGWPDQVDVAEMLMVNSETLTIDQANTSWVYTADLIGRSAEPKAVTTGTATSATATTLTDTGKAFAVNSLTGGILTLTTGTGAQQERTILSNTATAITIDDSLLGAFSPAPAAGTGYRVTPSFTPGVVGYTRDLIPTAGTRFFLDTQAGTIGTTEVTERVISFSVTVANSLGTKRFIENTDKASTRVRKGRRLVTGQLRLERDRARMDEDLTEYQRYHRGNTTATSWRRLRVRQTGPEIRAGVPKYAEISIPRIHYTGYTPDNRDGNSTITMAFSAYVDASALAIIERRALNTLAAIPS